MRAMLFDCSPCERLEASVGLSGFYNEETTSVGGNATLAYGDRSESEDGVASLFYTTSVKVICQKN